MLVLAHGYRYFWKQIDCQWKLEVKKGHNCVKIALMVTCRFFIDSFFNRLLNNAWLFTTLGKKALENIVGKGAENSGCQHFPLFPQCLFSFPIQFSIFDTYLFCCYTPVEDGTYYGMIRGGRASGRRPVLCPEYISKTTLARVMKFHGWIDLIQGECSAQES